MQYTRGEWTYYRLPEGWRIESVIGEQIAFSIPNEANARLIAASPRMAGLLQRLVTNGWNAGISEEAAEILQTHGTPDLKDSEETFREMYEALEQARQDINWMLNNQQFLNPDRFEYIDKALAKAESKLNKQVGKNYLK